MARPALIVFLLLILARPALAGPPYVSDDPEPTNYKHFEIYAFTAGTTTRDGTAGQGGIDFNYGAAPDLQLTAVLPTGFTRPTDDNLQFGLGNIQLAAKYRFLHQDSFGVDVSLFPRLFLPASVPAAGDTHLSCSCRSGWRRIGASGRSSAAADASSTPTPPRIIAWPGAW